MCSLLEVGRNRMVLIQGCISGHEHYVQKLATPEYASLAGMLK